MCLLSETPVQELDILMGAVTVPYKEGLHMAGQIPSPRNISQDNNNKLPG